MNKYIFELLAEKTEVFEEQVYHVYLESNNPAQEVVDLLKKCHKNIENLSKGGKLAIIQFPVGELVLLHSYDLTRCKLYTYTDALKELFTDEEWETAGSRYDLDSRFVNYIISE